MNSGNSKLLFRRIKLVFIIFYNLATAIYCPPSVWASILCAVISTLLNSWIQYTLQNIVTLVGTRELLSTFHIAETVSVIMFRSCATGLVSAPFPLSYQTTVPSIQKRHRIATCECANTISTHSPRRRESRENRANRRDAPGKVDKKKHIKRF